MVEITKYMLNQYFACELRKYLSVVGRGYTYYMKKTQLVDYIIKNKNNLLFIDFFQDFQSIYKSHLAVIRRKLKAVNREFLHEYHNNYFNMKIVCMTLMSEECTFFTHKNT